MTDPYLDALDFLYGRLNYERAVMPTAGSGELRLARMRRFLRRIGDPQDGLRILHVAGTKGKGSTSAMIAASLGGAGISTGLFTSPHLHRLEERFQVDGRPIDPGVVVSLVDELRPTARTRARPTGR
jgi:dihydrofolate synthase/folylpolyglutamate synthase